MSLAVHSPVATTSAASAPSDAAVRREKEGQRGAHGTEQVGGAAPTKGRHALSAALTDALEELGLVAAGLPASNARPGRSVGEREATQALHAFVHELFAALRPADMEGRTGRGFAWGRTSSADFGLRLDALVERLQGTAPTTPEPPATSPLPPASGPAPNVPLGVDPLLSAFQQLLAVARPAADSGGDPAEGTAALVGFLQRLSQAMNGAADSGSPVPGTLLDVTA